MIKCDFYDYDLKQWQQYELDLEMNIYPCCFFYLDKRLELNTEKLDDTTIDHIDNSLKTNKLETILKEFKKVLNENVWNSNNCPSLCKEKCER
tara:strand:+ start:2051 stop:2329 length:279 start_codon:yes stop_codon:yes gene_type:complete